jgi:hypothetical protein
LLIGNPPEIRTRCPAGIDLLNIATEDAELEWNATIILGGDWLNLISGASGRGTGSVTVQFDRNPDAQVRIGTVAITAPSALPTRRLFRLYQAAAGDFDIDDDIDLADVREYIIRMSGPMAPGSQDSWEAFDLDEDSDVDLSDWSRLMTRVTPM